MNDINSTALLAQMQKLADMASAPSAVKEAPAEEASFSSMLEGMVKQVNAAQQHGTELSEQFVMESEEVDLAEVMVAMQKARVHFETMVQVRNRLIRAYEEIMRMPM
jgi:flagellar hook-basal body complex protein FliE